MTSLLEYILKANGLLVVVYAFYYFFLRKETFFTAIRVYFLVGIVLSLLFPLLKWTSIVYVEETIDWAALLNNSHVSDEIVESKSFLEQLTLSDVATAVFYIGLAIGLFFFTLQLIKLLFHIHRLKEVCIEQKTIKVDEKTGEPYSFWKWIVLPIHYRKLENLDVIIQHEEVHIKDKHSCDLLLVHLLKYVFWFNPFVRLMERAIRLNLEFIVDEKVVNTQNSYEYQMILVQHKMQMQKQFVNLFGASDLKKRIIMINQPKSKNMKQLKFICIAPIITCFFYLFQVEVKAKIVQKEHAPIIADVMQNTEIDEIKKESIIDGTKEKLSAVSLDQRNDDQEKKNDKSITGFLYIINGTEYTEEEMKNKTQEELGINTSTRTTIITGVEGKKRYGKKGEKGVIVIESVSLEDIDKENTSFEESFKQRKEALEIQKEALKIRNEELLDKRRAEVLERQEEMRLEVNKRKKVLDKKKEEIRKEQEKLLANQDVITFAGSKNGFNSYNVNLENPLYIIDGKEVTAAERIDRKYLAGEPIRIYNVGDEEMKKKYGDKAKNGVIVINSVTNSTDDSANDKNVYLMKDKISSFTTSTKKNGNVINSFFSTKSNKDGKTGIKSIENLFVLDGKIIDGSVVKNISPNTIERMNVLKGKEAIKKYGAIGEAGVIEIVTKK